MSDRSSSGDSTWLVARISARSEGLLARMADDGEPSGGRSKTNSIAVDNTRKMWDEGIHRQDYGQHSCDRNYEPEMLTPR